MRTYLTLAACVAVAVFFVTFRADAQTLEGAHNARIISSTLDEQADDPAVLGPVMITPHFIGYFQKCRSYYVARHRNRLGGDLNMDHIPPQPAIECISMDKQEAVLFSEIMTGADEMRYDPAQDRVFIYADGVEIVVLELIK